MPVYNFTAVQTLRTPLHEAWDFFTSPLNLAKITPPDMRFRVLTPPESGGVYSGMEISYVVRPLFGIPLKWKTLIKEVNPQHEFTDVQMEGPYKIWEHRHIFKEIPGSGTEMTDKLRYQIPFGVIGRLAHVLFVKKRIREIFEYRRQTLEKIFNTDGNIN